MVEVEEYCDKNATKEINKTRLCIEHAREFIDDLVEFGEKEIVEVEIEEYAIG
jgi:hypothetical protein